MTQPRVLRRRAVEAMTGLSRSTIYARMKIGTFPTAIRLGGRSVGWLAEEIEEWIAACVAESRTPSATDGAMSANETRRQTSQDEQRVAGPGDDVARALVRSGGGVAQETWGTAGGIRRFRKSRSPSKASSPAPIGADFKFNV
jgi:prophage regulatory protein